MSTEQLMERLLADAPEDRDVIAALHELLDDRTIEADAPARGIADAAALTGLSPHTLRYYERLGLVRPERNPAGHREYAPADLRRLVFLARMRASGMSMRDLVRYVELVDDGEATVPERREMMLLQRDRIRRELRVLTLALETTEYKIRVYGGAPGD
jgi:DNA-binding transcriptional MerR regulator